MGWFKRDMWKVGIALAGLLLLLILTVLIPLSVSAHAETSALAAPGTLQATPTVDLTVTALAKEQLILQNKQLQQSEDRGFDAWVWNNAAAIVASFLSTLVVVIGALIGFWQWRTNRNDTLTKEANDRKETQDKELRSQAEERFQAAVAALGDDKESVQVGGAILLRSFLNEEDMEIYGRYYAQIFDLAVAYLRPSNTSLLTEDPDRIPLSSEELPIPLPLTPLRQALIIVLREAYPLARERAVQSLDATGIQLDHADLTGANLKRARMPYSSLLKADFAFASLQEVYLRGSHLEGAGFVGVQLKEGNLTIAHLEGANLNGAHLEEANLGGSYLVGAHFRDAHLKGAQLGNADLSNADLSGADMSRANLKGIRNLEKARSLKKANLRGVTGLTKAQLAACKAKGAIIDEDTMTSSPQPAASLSAPSQGNDARTLPPAPVQVSSPPATTGESDTASPLQSPEPTG